MQSMEIYLENPTDEVCQSFEAILTNAHYYSDADEDGNVCYTVFDVSEETIRCWIKQAKVNAYIND